jgi:Histidine kinase
MTSAHALPPRIREVRPEGVNLARTFKGLTWRRLGIVCIMVFAEALARVAEDVALGRTASYIAGHVLLSFGSMMLVFTPVLLAVIAVDNHAAKNRRVWSLALAIALAVAFGLLLNFEVHALFGGEPWKSPAYLVGGWFNAYFMAAIATTLYFFVVREGEVQDTLHNEDMNRLGLEREMTEARLQVMQAQIEPHFLFNTLANVRRLHQVDPPVGRAMLQHLSRYLGAALPQMRESRSTLGRELALTVAYLNIQKIRMGARLAFEVDVPDELQACTVPPMMLLTLAENAIRHGLVPLPDGGSVLVRARAGAGILRLQVVDTGRGLQESSGAGIGLANIRARLKSLYDADAQLLLANNSTQGVTATIELPVAMVGPEMKAASA